MEFYKIFFKLFIVIMIQNLSIRQLKSHYETLFQEMESEKNPENFKKFVLRVVGELDFDKLKIDTNLLERDLDEQVCKTAKFGALESLKRTLLHVAESANYKAVDHPDWSLLAGRIEIQRIKLIVPETFREMIEIEPKLWCSDIPDYLSFCRENAEELEAMLVPERDYVFYFFGIRTLEKSYLVNLINRGINFIETPQRLYLRVATFLMMPNFETIKEYYDALSLGFFTHASPTLFNSGLKNGALASCYLLSMQDDMEKIYETIKQTALISKATGGIGLEVSNIRHSAIGHRGQSAGIVPMLKNVNDTMVYANQEGHRKGSATIFLQPWHTDFPDFILLKRNQGKEERRARDLFYAVWNCDIFMERVKNNEIWSLFCPKKVPQLTETFGEEFEKIYKEAEENKLYESQVQARELWTELLTSQIETGMPFMTNKDTANYTSNQQNLGIIRSSNLCVEILEVTGDNKIASCNLASLSLDEYVLPGRKYDFKSLGEKTRLVIKGLNKVIDRTAYPLVKFDSNNNVINEGPIKPFNLKYRPLGLGVNGFADALAKMDLAFTDPETRTLNRDIFATIYYYATLESIEQAKLYGSYQGFYGSPASHGLLKPDLVARERARRYIKTHPGIDIKEATNKFLEEISPLYDWENLRQQVKRYGIRNSLLLALMPTASSAQIRYKTESFEPMTCNLYVRSVLAGNHLCINRYMVQDLENLGLWNRSIINFIMKNEGSIQTIPEELLEDPIKQAKLKRIKRKYLTAFEIKQKTLVDLSIERSPYVCQSQSLNVFIRDPTFDNLTNLHFYGWENGLPTGMYYLRTSPATEAVKFTLDDEKMVVSIDDTRGEKKFTLEGEVDIKRSIICTDEICLSCTS